MKLRRGALLTTLLAGGVFVASFPALAQTQRSPNMRQVAEVRVDWPDDKEPDGIFEMAFKGDLLVAGLRGNGTDNQMNGSNGGTAIFRIKDRTPFLRQLSVLHCQTTGELSIIGDVVVAATLKDHHRPETRCNRNGFQIIDISEPRQPRLAKFIELGCGVDVHTVAKANGRWYVIAPATCNEAVENPANTGVYSEMAIVRIDPTRPSAAEEVGNPLNDSVGCAEVFVLASRDLMVCLFFESFMLFDISDPINPRPIPGPTGSPNHVMADRPHYIFNRGAFTWDGQYLVLAGGPMGIDGKCDNEDDPSLFFYNIEDVSNPTFVGEWVVPRRAGTVDCFSQGLNVLPMRDPTRYVLAAGFLTHGVSIVDFSDPTRAREVAHYLPTFYPHDPTDPEDLDPYLTPRVLSSYWYNGTIYASAEGENAPRLRVFKVEDLDREHVRYFDDWYNPQTQIARFR